MSTLEQYGLLLGLTVGAVGFVLSLYTIARTLGKVRKEPGREQCLDSGIHRNDNIILYWASI